ncbi:MAG: hypothetical protein M3P70_16755 [Actinomycetota bacterium]|nr:hypothetical protein [Actinomycetota bacterium]
MDTVAILRELIAQTERPLALAEAEVRAAQERVEKVKAERFGLELALARHLGEPTPSQPSEATKAAPTDPESFEWQRLSRTDASLRVLQQAGRPMHRKELQAELHAHGRDDSLDHMSAALAYLNRSGRVLSKGYGMWVHPDHDHEEREVIEPQEAEDPAEAGSPRLSLMPSERRTEDVDHHPHSHPAPVVGV